MRELPFDDHGMNALLDGRVVADDAPPGFQDVARLIQVARLPATPDELAGQDHVVAILAAAVNGGAGLSGSVDEGKRPMLTKLVTTKLAAVAAAAALIGGGAAAATGSLPTSLQSVVSRGLSSVGISVPNPAAHATAHAASALSGTTTAQGGGATATKPATPPTQAVGPSVTGPASYGLCTAYTASSSSAAASHSVAFSNLVAAAAAKGESVAQFCAGAVPPSTAPSATGASHPGGTAGPSTGATTASSAGQASTNAGGPTPTTAGPPAGTLPASARGLGSASGHTPAPGGPPAGTPGRHAASLGSTG